MTVTIKGGGSSSGSGPSGTTPASTATPTSNGSAAPIGQDSPLHSSPTVVSEPIIGSSTVATTTSTTTTHLIPLTEQLITTSTPATTTLTTTITVNTTTTTQSTSSPRPRDVKPTLGPNGDTDDSVMGEMNPDNCLPNESEGNDDNFEPTFPLAELNRLDEMINRPRWVIPVLPRGELEVLLEASINLAKRGLDVSSEPCQRFYREGLTTSFVKVLTDEAVSGWKLEIHKCILSNCEKLIDLICYKLPDDCLPLLEILAIVYNPDNKFHIFTSTRAGVESSSVKGHQQQPGIEGEEEVYAKCTDQRNPRPWLVDLINRFGRLKGLDMVLSRFQSPDTNPLTIPLVCALLRPFGQCCELLTPATIEKYFLPIVKIVPTYLESLSDEELKKESTKSESSKSDSLSSIIKSLKSLSSRLPNQEELMKRLEIFRLGMILKLLKISSFNGKMNALNEVNKVISNVSFFPHRHGTPGGQTSTVTTAPLPTPSEEEYLTADKVAQWLKENNVLQIVLRDSLHQPQYVEKLEKIIRFVIKEKTLSLQDLDDLWAAQAGKHEAIVKNVHDLLAKLAWDFTPEQLDHLFGCFQSSWREASKKQREKLLELIRRLAEDDKDGVMAHKVLHLLWNLAHNEDVPNDIVDQALAAHVKILDYSCSQDRDSQKTEWLEKCINELKSPDGSWVLPALKQMREICCLYNEAPPNFTPTASSGQKIPQYRHEVINRLQEKHTLVILVSESLSAYMQRARIRATENPELDPTKISPSSRFSHVQEVQERLNFLRFLLKDGQLWLCSPQAKQIWKCLAENAVYPEDREACFNWFSQLMTEEPDLDPEVNRSFFEHNIMQLDATLVTESGIECFDRFFKAVNVREGKLIAKRRAYFCEDLDLIGLDYLWKVVLNGSEDVSGRAIELLKETYTNLGPHLQANQMDIHGDIISQCIDRLRAAFDTVSVILGDPASETKIRHEVCRMTRVLKVLYEYISQCDNDFGEERSILPMARSFRGVQIMLTIRFPNQGRQIEDIDIFTHSNDTLYSVRRQILTKLKASLTNTKIDLFLNGELIDPNTFKLVSQLPLKDKTILTGKLYPINSTNMPSSPDSSSESSSGSPQQPYEEPNTEAENCLPGVIMSRNPSHAQFFFQISDLGMHVSHLPLVHNALSILKIMPADQDTIQKIKDLCASAADDQQLSQNEISASFDSLFFIHDSPTRVAYNLIVIYSLLMPAQHRPGDIESQDFQFNFIKSGCGFRVIDLLTRNNFLSTADAFTKVCTYNIVLKITKLVLVTLGDFIILSSDPVTEKSALLQQALTRIPNPSSDSMVREVAKHIAQRLAADCPTFRVSLPGRETATSVIMIAWATATGVESALQDSIDNIRPLMFGIPTNQEELYMTCREALEVLTVSFMLSPEILSSFASKESRDFQGFVIDLLLICREKSIRESAMEQFALMATMCSLSHEILTSFVELLYSHLNTSVSQNYETSSEFFQLFCRLLESVSSTKCSLPLAQQLLEYEIDLIQNVRTKLVKNGLIEEIQLEGHLGITKEVISLHSPEIKYKIGCDPDGRWTGKNNHKGIIKFLIDEYIFPASRATVLLQDASQNRNIHIEEVNPICSSPTTLAAAFDVLVSLCTGCVPNLQLVADTLSEMFYADEDTSTLEWEYLPPIGPRPPKGFVGLKNAGATCYMNSVLQQLFMLTEIREGVLGIEGAINDPQEDFSGDEKPEPIVSVISEVTDDESRNGEETRKDYNIGVLKYVQAIFGHLALSKLQYYVPKGFWKHFKLWGEPVNLREQHDALEFFNSLVDSLDEALKALNATPIMSHVLGGSFADQKICKDCPHRYSREESFTTLNIDIRNHSNLLDSLEQYVKGDLLEGANAYHCEKCNRKVDTVKRLCIKKLPPVLAIQLKRFDYDWERETAIKFNDYFEFPRLLDMKPYTVRGLAQIEGEIIDDELVACDDETFISGANECTKYELCGIVVHSGQASGGHYYSYILYQHADGVKKWYKFDDGDVSECKLDDDEEMKIQCYGGDYMGEIFDHIMKRMSNRRQKRWWNAYILFYRRVDSQNEISLSSRLNELTIMETAGLGRQLIKMPLAIQRSVQMQNIRFMHNKNQFSLEYFLFMKKLLHNNGECVMSHIDSNGQGPIQGSVHEIALTCVQLASKFLFSTCFHTRKSLRGPATEWFEVLSIHLRLNAIVRGWFARFALLDYNFRFCDYLLECPATDVRAAFAKIVALICHFSLKDPPQSVSFCHRTHTIRVEVGPSIADLLMQQILSLLKKEVPEHSRHLTQFFGLFAQYAALGAKERYHLLKLNVPSMFIAVAVDDGPGPPIKYQYADFSKLFQVVSILIRNCDMKSVCQSSNESPDATLRPNPYGEDTEGLPLIPVQKTVAELLLRRQNYLKKLIESADNTDDTIALLKYCSWENPHFSSMVLNELLWQIAYSYSYELRPHLELLLHLLLMEDSWQEHRIHNALKGMQEDREGIFDTIARNRSHYQKRAYQCIKYLVTLFSTCPLAAQILRSNLDFRRKWQVAIRWLNEELERRPFGTTANQYSSGYNWSPPTTSNDTNNGYYLERSQSARLTLAKAVELLPQEEEHERRQQEMEVAEQELVTEPVTEAHVPHDEHYFPVKSPVYDVEEMLYSKAPISSSRRDAVIDSFPTEFRDRQQRISDTQKIEQFFDYKTRHMKQMKVKSVSPIVTHPSTSQMRQEQEHSISENKERKDSGEF